LTPGNAGMWILSVTYLFGEYNFNWIVTASAQA